MSWEIGIIIFVLIIFHDKYVKHQDRQIEELKLQTQFIEAIHQMMFEYMERGRPYTPLKDHHD